MRSKSKIVLVILLAVLCCYFYWQVKQKIALTLSSSTSHSEPATPAWSRGKPAIDQLTRADLVADYLHSYQYLPDYYIKKSHARQLGWQPSKGNLCEVLPGKAIGGDHFSNREAKLPNKTGRQWFEADVNYQCGRRSTDRLLYSSDGLIFVTQDHYRSFRRLF